MRKLLIRGGVQLASSAVAILLADILLPKMSLNIGGFITAVVIFTLAQSVVERLVANIATKHVPTFAGLASVVSTWLALIMATIPFGGIRIGGFFTWIIAALIIWAVTASCALLVPKYVLKSEAR